MTLRLQDCRELVTTPATPRSSKKSVPAGVRWPAPTEDVVALGGLITGHSFPMSHDLQKDTATSDTKQVRFPSVVHGLTRRHLKCS